MEIGVLKGPAELVASRVKGFKKCLTLATDCLSNKDYLNAKMIFAGIISDLQTEYYAEALNLNELDVFSLKSCFAYCSIGLDKSSSQALDILESLQRSIKLPLVPYLKAFVHIANNRVGVAHDEIELCKNLLSKGYNFKVNNILNEKIVPEVSDEFLKPKVENLFIICKVLRESKDDKKTLIVENLQLGVKCDPGLADVISIMEVMNESANKNVKPKNQNNSVKKVDNSSKKLQSIAIQTEIAKGVNVSVQTKSKDKENNEQLMTAVADIRNKLNSMQSKRDVETKQLQKKNEEFVQKLMERDGKKQEKSAEFLFLQEQYFNLEKKYEQKEKEFEFLLKLLFEQVQHKYQIHKNIYQMFEEKCDCKIDYLNDLQNILGPNDRPTPEECKHDVAMWRSILNKVAGAKRNFEAYYRTIDDLMIAKQFSTIKTSDWPVLPTMPNDIQDSIYRNFKIVIQQNKSFSSNHHSPRKYGNPYYRNSYNVRNFIGESSNIPNYYLSPYEHKEDGRTTGSPVFNPRFMMNAPQINKVEPFEFQNGNKNVIPPDPRIPSPVPPAEKKPPSDEHLMKLLQSHYKSVTENELSIVISNLKATYGNSLRNISMRTVFDEVQKVLSKNEAAARGSWNIVGKKQWNNDHSDTKCCICFEDYDPSNSHSLTCQHEFHKKCITDWLKRQNACPVCRVHAVIDEEFPPLKI